MGPDMHRKAMTWFRQYLIVGGMPQVVMQYAETKDFDKVDAQKRLILNLYRNDIRQYADNLENRSRKSSMRFRHSCSGTRKNFASAI